MKYYLVITPDSLIDNLIDESKRLMKIVYKKDVDLLYYRVQTKQKLDNPRRLFLKGDGRIVEAQLMPHVSLVHNIELDNPEDFISTVKRVCWKQKPLELKYKGVGNYDMDFTFYVEFEENQQITKLRNGLLDVSEVYISEEEHAQHSAEKFVPHATVLYDDVDPERVLAAYKLLDRSKFEKNVNVDEIVLWGVTVEQQEIIAKFKLGK